MVIDINFGPALSFLSISFLELYIQIVLSRTGISEFELQLHLVGQKANLREVVALEEEYFGHKREHSEGHCVG